MLLFAAVLSGCGGDSDSEQLPRGSANPQAADFPKPRQPLQQFANKAADGQARLALGSSVLTPGRNRIVFGVLAQDNQFVYGPTAVYVAPSLKEVPQGPFVAPLDSFAVDAPFRSRTSTAQPGEPVAVYAGEAPLKKSGPYYLLTLTKVGGKLVGGATKLAVAPSTRIPAVGERAPAVSTPTFASVGGDKASIDTRVPPDNMHADDFRQVIGKEPVALLFATPQLCQSRVCGPVTDIAAQLQEEYGDQMTFIHQEVYNDNAIAKGVRPQMRAFNLRNQTGSYTEPWLFTFDADGRVAARLEGSFGVNAFEAAVRRALE